MKRPLKVYLAVYIIVALMVALRVPMILPLANGGEVWRDVWAWSAFSQPSADVIAYAPHSETPSNPIPAEIEPVHRWGGLAERQVVLAFIGGVLYVLLFPWRWRIASAKLRFSEYPRQGFLTVYLLVAVLLFLYPPCIFVYKSSLAQYSRTYTAHRLLWERGQYQIEYGALTIEQLAAAALISALYFGYEALRTRRPAKAL